MEPSDVAPSENATVPVGVAPPEGNTTAVMETLPPAFAGDGTAVNVVVVVAEPMVMLDAADTDVPSFAVPPYVAMIE